MKNEKIKWKVEIKEEEASVKKRETLHGQEIFFFCKKRGEG